MDGMAPMPRSLRIPHFLSGDPEEQRRSEDAPRSTSTVVSITHPRVAQRHRYRRRHTLHFYLGATGLIASAITGVVSVVAYTTRSIAMATVSFFMMAVTALVVSTAFFWGFYMVANGNFPARRIKIVIPHAAVGTLSPLLYALNISLSLEGVGNARLTTLALICALLSFLLLALQFTMGRRVVRPTRLHVIRG
ncbi:MAG: hypothetical protein NVSMB52_00360 [Chloroflexota bacterium]